MFPTIMSTVALAVLLVEVYNCVPLVVAGGTPHPTTNGTQLKHN